MCFTSCLSRQPFPSLSKTLKDHLSLSSSFPRRIRWTAATYSMKSICPSWEASRRRTDHNTDLSTMLRQVCQILKHVNHADFKMSLYRHYIHSASHRKEVDVTLLASKDRNTLSMYADSSSVELLLIPKIFLNSCKCRFPLGHSLANLRYSSWMFCRVTSFSSPLCTWPIMIKKMSS